MVEGSLEEKGCHSRCTNNIPQGNGKIPGQDISPLAADWSDPFQIEPELKLFTTAPGRLAPTLSITMVFKSFHDLGGATENGDE